MAVLKCYSSELDSRLLLNGEESENKQSLYEFLKNSAKSKENCKTKFLNDLRVKYFYDKLISETQPLYDKILKLEIEKKDESLVILNSLYKEILENTCSVLFDFKCLFNNQIIGLLYSKIKSILNDPIFFELNTNNHKERLKLYHETINAFKYGLNKTCYVSLVKLDEESLKPHLLKMKNKRTIEDSEKINHDKKNDIQLETQSQQHHNFNSTCVDSNQSKIANISQNIFMSMGEVEITSDKKIKDHIEGKFKEQELDETSNQITTHNKNLNSNDEKLQMYPVVCLQKLNYECIGNTTGNIICEYKSANIIASQSIKCNKTINLVNKNKDMDRIVNSYKLDEECNNTIFKKPSINKNNKNNCEENATTKATKTNRKRKKSIKFNSKQNYYIHKKFRREERLKK